MMQFRGSESGAKEVIKKQLENSPKRKGGEKTRLVQMIVLIRRMLIELWSCIVGIIFHSLILGHHEFIFS